MNAPAENVDAQSWSAQLWADNARLGHWAGIPTQTVLLARSRLLGDVAWALLRLLRTFVDLGEEFGHSPQTGIARQPLVRNGLCGFAGIEDRTTTPRSVRSLIGHPDRKSTRLKSSH